MRLLYAQIALLLAVPAWAIASEYEAASNCWHCGEWRVYAGTPYLANSSLKISPTEIALPSCSAVSYTIARTLRSTSYSFNGSADVACPRFVVVLNSIPSCSRVMQDQIRPFAVINACSPTPWGNQELQIDMAQSVEQPPHLPSGFFGASLSAIPLTYDPCSSGGGHGQWMCTKFKLENAEAQLLLIAKRKKSFGLQSWLKKRNKQCKSANHNFSQSWSYKDEDDCKLSLTLKKTEELSGNK